MIAWRLCHGVGTLPMRRFLIVATSFSLLAVGCSSDLQPYGQPATTAPEPAPIAIDTTGPATSTTSASTTTSTSTTSTAAVSRSPIIPEVLCVGQTNGGTNRLSAETSVYFAYSNAGSSAAVVDAGPDNELTNGYPGDEPLVPTVFAPGRVSPAFSSYVQEDGTVPSWTLRGPDGAMRSTKISKDTPECTEALLTPTLTDPRRLDLAFSYHPSPEFSFPVKKIDLTITVIGAGQKSLCAEGLEPEAPVVWFENSESGTTPGATFNQTLTVKDAVNATTGEPSLVASTSVAAHLVDICGAQDSTSESWPDSGTVAPIEDGVQVCIRLVDNKLSLELRPVNSGCEDVLALPATGGVKTRSTLGF